MRILAAVHSSCYYLIEQPSGSWAYKQPDMLALIQELGLLLGSCFPHVFCMVAYVFFRLSRYLLSNSRHCRHRFLTVTWMAYFSHDMLKCTHLRSNMAPGPEEPEKEIYKKKHY